MRHAPSDYVGLSLFQPGNTPASAPDKGKRRADDHSTSDHDEDLLTKHTKTLLDHFDEALPDPLPKDWEAIISVSAIRRPTVLDRSSHSGQSFGCQTRIGIGRRPVVLSPAFILMTLKPNFSYIG
jgi:hypothetical protein